MAQHLPLTNSESLYHVSRVIDTIVTPFMLFFFSFLMVYEGETLGLWQFLGTRMEEVPGSKCAPQAAIDLAGEISMNCSVLVENVSPLAYKFVVLMGDQITTGMARKKPAREHALESGSS